MALSGETETADDEISCRSSLKVVDFSYTWIIDNFSFRREEVGKVLESCKFLGGSHEWLLRLYPRGSDMSYNNYLSSYLVLVSSNETEVFAKYSFSILNSRTPHVQESDNVFHFVKDANMGFPTFIARPDLLNLGYGYLSDDKLTIVCNASVVGDSVNVPGHSVQLKVPKCCLAEDFNALFINQKFSDFTLSSFGRDFLVHKAVLAARSKVFSAMFDHGSAESQNNRVKIKDVEPDILQEMLRFIYSGKISNLDIMADKLLAAADKYALERLKVKCEEALCLALSIDNASDTLILADLHSASQLKAKAIKFICANATKVMELESFKAMADSHPHLVVEAFKAVATLQTPPTKKD